MLQGGLRVPSLSAAADLHRPQEQIPGGAALETQELPLFLGISLGTAMGLDTHAAQRC